MILHLKLEKDPNVHQNLLRSNARDAIENLCSEYHIYEEKHYCNCIERTIRMSALKTNVIFIQS